MPTACHAARAFQRCRKRGGRRPGREAGRPKGLAELRARQIQRREIEKVGGDLIELSTAFGKSRVETTCLEPKPEAVAHCDSGEGVEVESRLRQTAVTVRVGDPFVFGGGERGCRS